RRRPRKNIAAARTFTRGSTAWAQSLDMIAWIPELLYTERRFTSGMALVCDDAGTIASIARVDELTNEKKIGLPRRAMMPGMVNAHSHAFQRVIRGRTEYRATDRDSFW